MSAIMVAFKNINFTLYFDVLVQAGHVCWDDQDVIHGRPTGAVRVSFGYMSTFEDCLVSILRKMNCNDEVSLQLVIVQHLVYCYLRQDLY